MVEPPLDCQITSTPVISRPSASTSDGDLSKQYCSTLLQELEMQQTDSDSDSEVEQDFLPPHVITELIDEVKRVLLPDLEASQRQVEHVVQVTVTVPALQQQGIMKRKWGPVLATRHSTRINNQLHVLTKAQLLLQKKNLEIPPTFKGKKLAKHSGGLGHGGCVVPSLETTLQEDVAGDAGELHQSYGTQTLRVAADRLALKPRSGTWSVEELQFQLAATNWFKEPLTDRKSVV